MISEAISKLKERNGSSQPAIAKAIEETHGKGNLPKNFKKIMSVRLKKLVKSEALVKVKNSYKINNATTNSSPQPPKKESAKTITSSSARKGSIKTKRLSQVKTPEGLKKKTTTITTEIAAKLKAEAKAKTKPLNQVKTPEGLKRKISSKATKKAKK